MGPDDVEDGFPQDGDEFQDGPAPPPANPPTPTPATPPQADPLADIRARMERLERENADLKRLIPPATAPRTPAPNEPPASAFDQVDWDKELFASPKAALRKAVEIAKEETTRELRAEYQRDNGTRQFWDRFYSKHPDLRDDHDLVEVTLNSNLSTLSNIRVEDAYDKLAELTRERIIRYAGGARRGRKAVAEGGGGTPTPPTPPVKTDDTKVASLSSYLRDRRSKRRAGAA